MTTKDVVQALAKRWDLSQAETRRLLDTLVDILKKQLAEGKRITITELGTFGTHTREERKSYNPHYKQYMLLPPKRVVDFTPSKGLKEDMKELEV